MENILLELQKIKDILSAIEQTQKVILCCSLLPKDGPNWDYYEHLFSSAEKMLHSTDGLSILVRNILLKNTTDSK